MSSNNYDPHLGNRHSDELIPEHLMDEPITWLDEIGLGAELDLAVQRVKELLDDCHEYPEEKIRLAIAAWLHRSLRQQLEQAKQLAADGAQCFFSILRSPEERESTLQEPPPPPPQGHSSTADQVF